MNTNIKSIYAREILDSRGNPTVEGVVVLNNGSIGICSVPSGASTGIFEAHELRDNDISRYNGKGVLKAIDNIEKIIAPKLVGMNALNQKDIDNTLIKLDGTDNKSFLGANAILAVSIANLRAAAQGQPLYRYIGGINATTIPIPLVNVLNGGAHSSNNVDIQEFMLVPLGFSSFKERIRACAEVYHTLGNILKSKNLSTAVGDEGGYAPNLKNDEEAFILIIEAIKKSGYTIPGQFMLSIDVACSEWYKKDKYILPKSGKSYTTSELISYWADICGKYPIFSLEDPLGEDDWCGWEKITTLLGDKVKLVGDDLFVTNTERLNRGIHSGCGNSILIKPNQIGTVSQTISAVQIAHKSGFTTIISHRSGETEDTTIADLAVGLSSGYIKTGSTSRGERTAKYNRLLRIEEELGL